MREIIKQERLIELAFEGQRFWDLRRWKDAHKHLNEPIKGWNIGEKGLDFYKVTTVYPQPGDPVAPYDFKDYLWPIKVNEIIKNPNLVQNPGW